MIRCGDAVHLRQSLIDGEIAEICVQHAKTNAGRSEICRKQLLRLKESFGAREGEKVAAAEGKRAHLPWQRTSQRGAFDARRAVPVQAWTEHVLKS